MIKTEVFSTFNKDGEYLPICESILSVEEMIRYKGVVYDSYIVRYDFNRDTRLLILKDAVKLSCMDIEVTYIVDIFEQRRLKIKKLLNG